MVYITFLFTLILLVYVGISLFIADRLTTITQNPLTIQPAVISKNYEEITFQTPDGITLKGWLFTNSSKKLVILVAGHGQNRENPDYGGVKLAKDLIAQGYNVLMYDARGNGVSQKTRAGFGFGTAKDILGAISFARNKGFEPKATAIIADSMGATATILIADKLSNIGALVVDSPAAELEPIVSAALWREKHIPYVFHLGIFLSAKILFDVDIPSVKPIQTITLVPNRIFLFLHGADDITIPIENSRLLLAKANPASKLIVFPHAGHVQTYKTNPALYRKEVFGFLEKNLH